MWNAKDGVIFKVHTKEKTLLSKINASKLCYGTYCNFNTDVIINMNYSILF